MRRHLGLLVVLMSGGLAGDVHAQIRVHPTGVNVNVQGATTAFLTYGGLTDYEPIEATWCGALVPAAPHLGLRCDPASLYGQLPLRLDRSQLASGTFTDIMSIPASVSRRAYQAASAGEHSDFYYVRRFRSHTAGRPDQYVAVTCRLAGGGARTPFALVDVTLRFAGAGVIPIVRQGSTPPVASAEIIYTGTGRLVGRWEVVQPGETPPAEVDLVTEATLPHEMRAQQRRYTTVGRFNLFLPPDGRVSVPGPEVERLPTAMEGQYLLLLRIEAVTDKEGDSDRGAAGAGSGIVAAGAVAGFPMPVLRYVVGSGEHGPVVDGRLTLLAPLGDVSLDRRITFVWSDLAGAGSYRVEITGANGAVILAALTPGSIATYFAPPWLSDRARTGELRWRVTAHDVGGREIGRSTTVSLRLRTSPGSSSRSRDP